MELMKPSSNMDFKFHSACNSPFISAPSSPQRFGSSFYSAPTSPTAFCRRDFFASVSEVPFGWEEKPGIPKIKDADQISTAASSNYGDADEDLEDTDFAFDFSGHLERVSLSADELFDGGKIKIKPLKPPPRLHFDKNSPLNSPRSPKRSSIKEALSFSPRHGKQDLDLDPDPFEAALEKTRKEKIPIQENENRGRDGGNIFPKSRHKVTRSLSPLRVSDLLFDPPSEINQDMSQNSSSNSSFSSFWYKKWKIKDLLLFRSASEGHASEKEGIKKYSLLKKRNTDEVKNSSFRSTDSSGSVSSRRRTVPPISAHEFHYTVNRAVSEEMKKRTFLPYKQGLLGCLGFQPEFSNKPFGSTGSLSSGIRRM